MELWTLDDLAKFLKLSRGSAQELTKARTRARQIHPVPMIRVNSHPRFVPEEVMAWIQRLREEQEAT